MSAYPDRWVVWRERFGPRHPATRIDAPGLLNLGGSLFGLWTPITDIVVTSGSVPILQDLAVSLRS